MPHPVKADANCSSRKPVTCFGLYSRVVSSGLVPRVE
jgi:hypothetical protein